MSALSREMAEGVVAAANDALGKNHRPPGVRGKGDGAIAVASKALGISEGAFRNRLRVAKRLYDIEPDWSLYKPPEIAETIEEKVQEDSRLIRLQSENARLRAELKVIHQENLQAEDIRGIISGLSKSLPEPPDWAVNPKSSGTGGCPVALFSDWHVGEVVSAEQVGGVNEFNLAIAEERVRRLVEKIIALCFKHSVHTDYPGIVVPLMGDMVSGNIHELSETNEGTIMEQVKETYRLLAWALTQLADHFGRVFVPCTVGNHGRNSMRPKAKNRVQDNFEFLLYHFLEARFVGDNRFRFYIPGQTDALYTVAGHRILQTHGDSTGARGGDGIIGAIGPIVRGEKKVRDVQAMIKLPYDTCFMGHYHQRVSLDSVIVNPCLKGWCEFAKNDLRCRPERPAQMLIFIHPEQGIIDERRVFVDDPGKKEVQEWVSHPMIPEAA